MLTTLGGPLPQRARYPKAKTVHKARKHPAVEAAMSAGRVVTRAAGIVSASLRPAPDFLLVGAKRGGTTSTYFHILSHPDVLALFPSAKLLPKGRDTKGTSFFTYNFHKGSIWYLSHFPSRTQRLVHQRRTGHAGVAGEASPYYLFHPLAAQRAHDLVPDAKILIALRDPVDRTHSAWREQTRNGVETLSFEDALDAEETRLGREAERLVAEPAYISFAHEFQSYATQSRYAESLARWFALFPREQIHIWASEDYYQDANATVAGITAFLGLDPKRLPAKEQRLNAAPKSDMAPATRERLRRYFAEDVAATERLVGRTLPWPNFA
ncbi:MAG: sulfotransferase domain-containing protein [Tetrasphaera sp.]